MKKLLFLLLIVQSLHSEQVSWYGEEFRGRRTANGELFNPDKLTCASRRYPLGTVLEIRYGIHSVIVRVNDRISKKYQHRLDLSRQAFSRLAPLEQGLVEVKVEVLH